MTGSNFIEKDFITQITIIVEENISNEQFGVTELADHMNMSRSNLLRKVKKETKLSVSQLIREVRLKRAMDLLKTTSLNVSEVSHQVGFSSTSYFIKCFREHYGYPPGEVGKRAETESIAATVDQPVEKVSEPKKTFWILGASIICVVAIAVFLFLKSSFKEYNPVEKSIVVLPFKNDSDDSTNIYLINGLMESTLNNLQRFKDLRVISRTSAEKYRNTKRTIPEMAKELNVKYFVEGSGQKIGDKILLNIQLIDGRTDKHLWSKQYRREAKDIFGLQQEIAKNIAEEIEVIITPEDKKRIEKNPTESLVAYDCFLKARDLFSHGGTSNLEKSIPLFRKAIAEDENFALAHAELAMVYYYLDIFQINKKYAVEINTYADKALLLDPKSPNSLVAKAMFYMHKKDYQEAVPFLEKALEYNPNSFLVINFLSDLYNNYIPNTAKYVEYALKGIRLSGPGSDSTTASYNYLHLSNALIQAGFIDEALKNVDQSLAYKPDNAFSKWVRIFILYAKDRDAKKAKQLLEKELDKNSMTNFIVLEELGKVCYLMRDYKTALGYYEQFIKVRDAAQLDIFKHESLKMAVVFSKMGYKEKADEMVAVHKQFVESDKTIYRNLNLAGLYAYLGDRGKAIEYMKLFAKEDNFQYWVLLLRQDPIVDSFRNDPEFIKAMDAIDAKFWKRHKAIRETLQEQKLM